MNGWFLIYKKIWDNPILRRKPYAIVILLWLLTYADDEGNLTCGRKQIANETGINENIVKYWLGKFSSAILPTNDPIITIKTTNKFSKIHICNFKKLQRKLPTKLPTNQQKITNKLPLTNNKEYNTSAELERLLGVELGSVHHLVAEYADTVDLVKCAQDLLRYQRKKNLSWSEPRLKQEFARWVAGRAKQPFKMKIGVMYSSLTGKEIK